MQESYVYIMASKPRGTLYTGVTSTLQKRVEEHRTDAFEGFTKKHQAHTLVYYEPHPDIATARERETQMKSWKRWWKIELVEKANPDWKDLYETII